MKLSNIVLAAAVALSVAGPAAAATSSEVAADVRSAITTGNVYASVNGSDVTLFGWVGDAQDKASAESAALAIEGVDKVFNRIIETN